MAGLFLLISVAILAAIYRKRSIAIAFWTITLIGALLMIWHHATDTLKINW